MSRLVSGALVAGVAMLGAANLAYGVRTALEPGQSQDLRVVRQWGHEWLVEGRTPYRRDQGQDVRYRADYPPHAIVLLSPLGLVNESALPGLWAAVNLVLAPLAALLAIRLTTLGRSGAPLTIALATLGVLLWAGVRIGLANGQFALLSVTAGLGGCLLARSHPRAAGFALGVALVKPHVGGAFLLWALLVRHYRPAAIATVMSILAGLLFSLRLLESPRVSFADFWTIAFARYGTPPLDQGDVELRPLVHWLIADHQAAEISVALILMGALIALFSAARRSAATAGADGPMQVLQLCCLWFLLAGFQHTFNIVLLLPVYAALCASVEREAGNHVNLWILIALGVLLVVDPAGIGWKTGIVWLSHVSRVAVLALFVVAVWRSWQPAVEPDRAIPDLVAVR